MKRILSGFQIRSPDRGCSGLFLASGIMQRRFWGSEEARCEGFSMEKRSFPERGIMRNLQGSSKIAGASSYRADAIAIEIKINNTKSKAG